MATLSLKVKSYQNSKGLHQVVVTISHKTKTCSIATPIYVSDISHLKGTSIVKEKDFIRKTKKLNELLETYNERLQNIPNINMYNTLELKTLLVSASTRPTTIVSVAEEWMSNLAPNTKYIAQKSIMRWLAFHHDTPIQEITPMLLDKYVAHLKAERYSASTIKISIQTLHTIVFYAIRCQYIQFGFNPFMGLRLPPIAPRDLPLSLEVFRTIYNAQGLSKRLVFARDMFLLSFFTGGTNAADICQWNYHKGDNIIKFVRAKTRTKHSVEKTITMPITDDARAILDKYATDKGKLSFGRDNITTSFTFDVNQCVKALKKHLHITDRLVFYTARKGFAQFALDLEYPDSTVDACLGHANSSRGIISYYSKVRVEQMRKCIQGVADYAIGRTAPQE